MNRREFASAALGSVAGLAASTQTPAAADLIVRGGRVVTTDGVTEADVAITGGRIVGLGTPQSLPQARRVIDARGKYVLPGLLDSHVHFNTPFTTTSTRDDFYTGSITAAFGGTTTYIDFAVQPKGRDLLSVVKERRAEADPHTVVDYSLHMLMTDASPGALAQIPEVIQAGMPSFKLFMAFGREGLMLDDGQILQIMRIAARHDGIVAVHTENNAIAESLTDEYRNAGQTSSSYFPGSRPRFVELDGIRRALLMAEIAGVRYYGFHLTIAEGVEEFRRARSAGRPVTTETCTHYLVLTEDVYRRPDGVNFVCVPPLRPRSDVDALWRGIQDGVISVITSDHTAWDTSQKRLGGGAFIGAAPGLPSLELKLPVLYTEGVVGGRIGLPKLVDLLSTSLAKVWGLYPQKGSLTIGADADLVIFDPAPKWTVDPAKLHMKVDWSPYAGRELQGRIDTVIARGDVVVDNGEFRGQRGRGRFIPRKLS